MQGNDLSREMTPSAHESTRSSRRRPGRLLALLLAALLLVTGVGLFLARRSGDGSAPALLLGGDGPLAVEGCPEPF